MKKIWVQQRISEFATVVGILSFAATAGAAVVAKDPLTSPHARIDRFSDEAGHLFKRSSSPALPGADVAIQMDQAPFITEGFAADGSDVSYYNLDVQAKKPAPIYVLFKKGAAAPLEGQLNLVDVIPGDEGYSDFWNVVKVTVPDEYVANQITSVEELKAAGFVTEATKILVNCPIVPAGSTAKLRYNGSVDTGLHLGWYNGLVIQYFNFDERALTLSDAGRVPVSPIYVTFNKNPDPLDPTSGPASGFVIDAVTGRTHNVVLSVPEQASYSPLWYVEIFDNHAFAMVHDGASAEAAPLLVEGAALVNCPVVSKSVASSAN